MALGRKIRQSTPMDMILSDLSALHWALALGAAVVAGCVKGIVGFAMPMVFISLLSIFMPPEWALAGLMLPTLITNGVQALRQGLSAALEAARAFRVYLIVGGITLVLGAQLFALLPIPVLLGMIGLPIVGFSLLQIAGWTGTLARQDLRVEAAVAAVAGFFGGLSGIWGPPTVAYLTALGTEKRLQMRAQGIVYGLGALGLVLSHGPTGVVRQETMLFSAALCLPALAGMWLGTKVQDRIDQATFRKATLLVLLIAGLNLIRRAILG